MKKKGQGISLETIITAAIVLVVLVVLWAIFTGRIEFFSKGLSDENLKSQFAASKLSGCHLPNAEFESLFGNYQSANADGKNAAARAVTDAIRRCDLKLTQSECGSGCTWKGG